MKRPDGDKQGPMDSSLEFPRQRQDCQGTTTRDIKKEPKRKVTVMSMVLMLDQPRATRKADHKRVIRRVHQIQMVLKMDRRKIRRHASDGRTKESVRGAINAPTSILVILPRSGYACSSKRGIVPVERIATTSMKVMETKRWPVPRCSP